MTNYGNTRNSRSSRWGFGEIEPEDIPKDNLDKLTGQLHVLLGQIEKFASWKMLKVSYRGKVMLWRQIDKSHKCGF